MTTSDVSGRAGFDSRTVRIFISSTFRDFAGERDLLVRKVFPELRRRCRERQVELVDVDLRWGITEAEAEQGKVLPICLAEIDRARPFFMGLLGERYGWVPAAGQFDRSLLIEQPWLEEHAGGKSVTELEILHGVLNNPEMAGRAFFYFRDPAWSATQAADYTTGSEAERQKLADLKDRIRTTGFPVVENYADPEALAERVREDLWTLIDAAYPEADVPDPLTLERRRHEAYAASRRRLYLGRERYFEALDAELAAESPRPVLVRGRSGGGKSALLANWLARWSQAHPDTVVIVHHLGCGADAADPVRMAVRIMQEIAQLVGEEFKPKSDPEEQLDELATWLATASAWAGRTGRTVLIVLDGLDKLSDRRHLRWFPTVLPPGVRLVASCLDGEVLKAATPRLSWRELVIEPFSMAEQTQFIGEYLGRFRKQLTGEQTRALQAHPLVGNPLFLLTVLEELRVFGVHERLDQRLATLLSPPPSKQPGEEPSVDDAFEHVLARVEADHGAEPVQRVMEGIWASRAGLYTDEILAIAEVAPATWAGIANALDESLYETSGRINFGHDYLRKAVEDRYAIEGDTRLTLNRRLAEYFNLFEPDTRIAEELPWQWRESQSRTELRECLINLKMFAALYSRDEYELLGYWVWVGGDASAAYEAAYGSHVGDLLRQRTVARNLAWFLKLAGCSSDFLVSLYQVIIQDDEQRQGPEHLDTLRAVNALAWVLAERGDYETSSRLYLRAVEGQMKTLGLHHESTLMCLSDAARLLQMQGDYVAAHAIYRQALEGCSLSFGDGHPLTLIVAGNLAGLLSDQGNYDDAEALLKWVLAEGEQVDGVDHPNSLSTINNLALLYKRRGAYAGAEAMYRRARQCSERSMGSSHPTTLSITHNLANVFGRQGDVDAATALHELVLSEREQSLGHDHPDTCVSIASVANLLRARGEYDRAKALYQRALVGLEKSLGPDHPSTLNCVSNVAGLLSDQGEHAAAETLYRRALAGFEKVLGPDHPNTLQIAGTLAESDDATTPVSDGHAFPDPPGTITNSIGMKLVTIPAGEFLMGSPEDCSFGDPDEEFQHRVWITKPFLIGMHQVTQSQYEKVTGENPSFFKGPDLPVEHLTWNEAQQFCERLSGLPKERAAGRHYRLPTEPEWEYACRAGTSTRFNTGDTLELHQARFATTSRSSPKPTVPVGSYPPNAWGLYDMHGNVWEWTSDWFSADYFRESPIDDPQGPATGTHHTLRGGSASMESHECRSAFRGEAAAVDGPETETRERIAFYGDFGIRVVCQLSG